MQNGRAKEDGEGGVRLRFQIRNHQRTFRDDNENKRDRDNAVDVSVHVLLCHE